MCWFHMRKSIKDNEHLKKIGDATIKVDNEAEKRLVRDLVIEDIHALQIAPSEKVFDVAVQHFLAKWKRHDIPFLKEFLEYFNKEWVVAHKGWFVSYVSTNNGLESINGVIKDQNTYRDRLPLAQFLDVAVDLVRNWSKERDPEQPDHRKPFAVSPSVPLKLNKRAYAWLKASQPMT